MTVPVLLFLLFCVIVLALIIRWVMEEVELVQNPGLQTLLKTADALTGVQVRLDYSGTYTYGASCVGFATDSETTPIRFLGELIEELVEADEQDALLVLAKLLRRSQVDSLGLGKILYFPGVEAPTESFEDINV